VSFTDKKLNPRTVGQGDITVHNPEAFGIITIHVLFSGKEKHPVLTGTLAAGTAAQNPAVRL
jgi:hypothetical protein